MHTSMDTDTDFQCEDIIIKPEDMVKPNAKKLNLPPMLQRRSENVHPNQCFKSKIQSIIY